jgi:hypothetical protein
MQRCVKHMVHSEAERETKEREGEAECRKGLKKKQEKIEFGSKEKKEEREGKRERV